MREKKQEKKIRRARKVRARILANKKLPRLSVFRSLKHIYAQLIDDEKGKTISVANDLELKKEIEGKKSPEKIKDKKEKTAVAFEVGKLIAKKSLAKKIEKVVFDRGNYKYHGRVKALAEGARQAGLKF